MLPPAHLRLQRRPIRADAVGDDRDRAVPDRRRAPENEQDTPRRDPQRSGEGRHDGADSGKESAHEERGQPVARVQVAEARRRAAGGEPPLQPLGAVAAAGGVHAHRASDVAA